MQSSHGGNSKDEYIKKCCKITASRLKTYRNTSAGMMSASQLDDFRNEITILKVC